MQFVAFFKHVQDCWLKKKNHVNKLTIKYHNFIGNFKFFLSLEYLLGRGGGKNAKKAVEIT